MITTRTTIPTNYTDVITLAEAERQCKLDSGYDSTILTDMLNAACHWVEVTYGVALKSTTVKMVADSFPCFDEYFAVGPVSNLTSVEYVDSEGTTQTLAATKYSTDFISTPARIRFDETPTTKTQLNAVVVTYTAGFSVIPFNVKQAVLMMVSSLYENRSNEITGTIVSSIKTATDRLMQPHRNYA